MMRRIAFASLVAAAQLARAQSGSIVGIVRDSTGVPVSRVEISLGDKGARTTSDDDGRFKFNKVAPGSYTLTTRRVGYYPQGRDVVVRDSRVNVEFSLAPLVRALPAVVTAVARGGLSGVVIDSAQRVIGGAKVKVLGGSREVVTDSSGAFYTDVRAGRYMVQVTHEGYTPRTISVTVPKDSGRRVLIGLAEGKGDNIRERVGLFELNQRMIRTAGPLHFFTREDLNKMGMKDLDRIASYSVVHPVDRSCMAQIGGEAYSLPIWSIDAADIEFLEVYTRQRQNTGMTRDPTNPRFETGGCPSIIVWFRK
jgi:hypothetical protein